LSRKISAVMDHRKKLNWVLHPAYSEKRKRTAMRGGLGSRRKGRSPADSLGGAFGMKGNKSKRVKSLHQNVKMALR